MIPRWITVGACMIAVAFSTGCISSTEVVNVDSWELPSHPIAYIQDGALYVSDSFGENRKNISSSDTEHFAPVWLPGAEEIMYGTITDDYYELWKYSFVSDERTFVIGTRNKPSHLQIANSGKFLLYQEVDNLFLIDLETLERTRLHEGIQEAAWSPDSKAIAFLTSDNRVLLQDFTINAELDDPSELFTDDILSLTFLDERTLLFEGEYEGEYTLLAYNLATQLVEPFTSLRFTQPANDVVMQLEPNNGDRIIYVRPNDTTLLPQVWMLHIDKDVPKLALTNVYGVSWSSHLDMVYYIESSVDDDGNILPTIMSATAAGLNKTIVIENGHSIASPVQYVSNEFTL